MTGLAVESAVSPDLIPLEQVVEACLLVLRIFEPSRTSSTGISRNANPAGAGIAELLEQQLLADSNLTAHQAVALAAAFRGMYAAMVVGHSSPGALATYNR